MLTQFARDILIQKVAKKIVRVKKAAPKTHNRNKNMCMLPNFEVSTNFRINSSKKLRLYNFFDRL